MIGILLRRPWRLPRLALALPALVGYPLGLSDRGRLKAAIARAACGGLDRATVEQLARRYVARVVPARLFEPALRAIAMHRANADTLVLMSASPDLYVPLLGRALGFDEIVCTRLSWQADRFEGQLASPNCRGAEKLRALARLRATHPGLPAIAYGNSAPDLEHLRQCEEAVYVNARGTQREKIQSLGIRTVDWR